MQSDRSLPDAGADTDTPPERRRWSRRALLVLALMLGFVLAFAALLLVVIGGDPGQFDHALMAKARAWIDPGNNGEIGLLALIFIELTHLGGTVALGLTTAVVVGLLLFECRYRAAALVVSSVLGGALLSTALKLGIGRPRPDLFEHLVVAHSPSFPSGHAMLSAVVYLTLGALLARFEFVRAATRHYVLACAVAMTLLIGCSRVVLGVHCRRMCWPAGAWALPGQWRA